MNRNSKSSGALVEIAVDMGCGLLTDMDNHTNIAPHPVLSPEDGESVGARRVREMAKSLRSEIWFVGAYFILQTYDVRGHCLFPASSTEMLKR